VSSEARVANVFCGIQGEGAYIGAPAVFLQFTGCNRSCPTCDSKPTWTDELNKADVISPTGKSVDFIVQKVWDVSGGLPVRPLVVLTGGEPSIVDSRVMEPLLQALSEARFRIHLETNGSTNPPWFRGVTHVAVSPKIATSLKNESWKQDSLTTIDILEKHQSAELKLVIDVENKEDINRAEWLLSGIEAKIRYPITLQMLVGEKKEPDETYANACERFYETVLHSRKRFGKIWAKRPLRILPQLQKLVIQERV